LYHEKSGQEKIMEEIFMKKHAQNFTPKLLQKKILIKITFIQKKRPHL